MPRLLLASGAAAQRGVCRRGRVGCSSDNGHACSCVCCCRAGASAAGRHAGAHTGLSSAAKIWGPDLQLSGAVSLRTAAAAAAEHAPASAAPGPVT